jgi:hypothetical protein
MAAYLCWSEQGCELDMFDWQDISSPGVTCVAGIRGCYLMSFMASL